jgi:hypothetical protein
VKEESKRSETNNIEVGLKPRVLLDVSNRPIAHNAKPRPASRIWRNNELAPASSRLSLAGALHRVDFRARVSLTRRKSRTAKVVPAVDFFAALSEVMFQVPQIGRQLDLGGHPFCFLNHLVNLSPQGSVEALRAIVFSDLD